MSHNSGSKGWEKKTSARLTTVQIGIQAIWAILVVDLIVVVVDWLTAARSGGLTVAWILWYCLWAVFPYKLQKRSNATRFIYGLMSAAGVGMLAAGMTDGMSTLGRIVSIIEIPVVALSVYALFSESGEEWFSKSRT